MQLMETPLSSQYSKQRYFQRIRTIEWNCDHLLVGARRLQSSADVPGLPAVIKAGRYFSTRTEIEIQSMRWLQTTPEQSLANGHYNAGTRALHHLLRQCTRYVHQSHGLPTYETAVPCSCGWLDLAYYRNGGHANNEMSGEADTGNRRRWAAVTRHTAI